MTTGVEFICPQCNGTFKQRLLCPKCGVRLLSPDAPPPLNTFDAPAATTPGQHGPWSRIIIGLLLAQGLFYGLRMLTDAIHLAIDNETPANEWWASPSGFVVQQTLQIFGLLVGSVLAGAGQRRGFLVGILVGLWNGLLFLLMYYLRGQDLNAVVSYGQPIIQAAFGLLGGYLGNLIWKPLPSLTSPVMTPTPVKLPDLKPKRHPAVMTGPIAWGRVMIGIVVAVLGTIWANKIRDFVLSAAEGKINIETRMQAEFLTWEISVLAMLAGSTFAGANTTNGMKQGWAVGLGAGFALIAIYLYFGGKGVPAQSLGFDLAGIRLPAINIHLQHFLFTLISVISLGLIGGWFGGQLLPPLSRRRKAVNPY
jgi:hypothetical protein